MKRKAGQVPRVTKVIVEIRHPSALSYYDLKCYLCEAIEFWRRDNEQESDVTQKILEKLPYHFFKIKKYKQAK